MTRVILACLLWGTGLVAYQQQATAVLWRDPGPIAEKNLQWGPGAPDRQPAPPFTFVKEDLSGSKPKIRVTDAKGVAWNVKFPAEAPEKNEVNPEVAANRIIWALGYFAEEHYYVPSGTIEKVGTLQRASVAISRDGAFRTARFERRDASAVRTEKQWSLDANPFAGSRELSGLKILIALLNNWDNKPENSAVELVTTPEGVSEERYFFSDWGAAFGRMSGPPAWAPAPTRWNVEHYKEQPLTRGAADGLLKLHFLGQLPIDGVPLEHARWFAALASQLQPEQLRAAFEAAGASASEAAAFATRLKEKIDELSTTVQSL